MNPQYFLNVRSFQANFEIRLNDVLVESDYDNRNTTYAVPVNHWLHRGANTISIRLLPHDGQSALPLKARLELEIQRGTATGADGLEMSGHFTLLTQDISGEFDDPVPAFMHTAIFGIAERLNLPWEGGTSITLSAESVRNITRHYEHLHRLMEAKDADGFVAATRIKIADCATALGWDLQEDLRFTREHFEEIFNKPGYVVWPLSLQQLIPSVEGFGKLVTLRNEKKQAPLLLYNEAAGSCIFIDIKLYRPEGAADFVVIR